MQNKMQYKRLKLSSVLLLGLGLTGVKAQTMYVKESGGTQTDYALSNIQKMTFSSGNLTITKTDDSNGVYTLNSLRYLNFTDLTTYMGKPINAEKQSISTYPNPVSAVLNIDLSGIDCRKGTIDILNLEGRIMKTYPTSDQEIISVDISQLPQGIYLCRYSNGTKIKTVKIIKK